jgi:hypothetical protein
MAVLRARRHDEVDPFSDLLFNTLLIFVMLFAIALVAMNPAALKAEPYELLMPPERAFAIRRALASIREIQSIQDEPAPPILDEPMRKIRT